MRECSLFSTPSPAFIVCRLFDDGHSEQCEAYLIVVLICISLIMNNVGHLFILFVMSVYVFSPLFDWVVCFSGIQLYDLFVYFGN